VVHREAKAAAAAAIASFPVGTLVVLTGLQEKPELNGTTGVVAVAARAEGERLGVRLLGGAVHRGPPLSIIKMTNLRLAPRPVETLDTAELEYSTYCTENNMVYNSYYK